MPKRLILFVAILGILAMTGCRHNFTSAPLDYGEAAYQANSYISATFEESIQNGDLILEGRCVEVEPKNPEEGYTSYLFDVVKVIRGTYEEKQFRLGLPRVETTLGGKLLEVGKDEYEVGKKYYLVLYGNVYLFDPYYGPVSFFLNLNISDQKYEYWGNPVQIPDGMTVRTFLEQCFDAVPHEPVKAVETGEYADEFEEFYEESTWIIRGRAVHVPVSVAVVSTTVEVLEVLKGDAARLEFNTGSRQFTVATLEDTMIEGQEYIIGLSQKSEGTYYRISTRTAVKATDPDLIEKITVRNQN